MNLRSQLRVEQGYRIGHPHQYQGAPSGRMHAKIVILRFESDDVAADPGGSLLSRADGKAAGIASFPGFRESRRRPGASTSSTVGARAVVA
jgi:hypothetical protein